MSETTTVEAVIISGPRRGEIVNLDPLDTGAIEEECSEETWALLRGALQEMNQELVGLVQEVKGLKADLQSVTSSLTSKE